MEKSKLTFRILILVVCCFHLPAHSQEPYQKLIWGPHFNTCEGVTPAWEGGYIFTDRTIAKISVTGDPEWARNYKVNTWLNSIVKTFDSCYIATGEIWYINNGLEMGLCYHHFKRRFTTSGWKVYHLQITAANIV